MDPNLTPTLVWWVSVVELPALAGLFWLNWRTRRDLYSAIDDTRHQSDRGLMHLRDSLSAYKLEVAKTYASLTHLKETERRLTRHLIRIEDKLDSAAHMTRRKDCDEDL